MSARMPTPLIRPSKTLLGCFKYSSDGLSVLRELLGVPSSNASLALSEVGLSPGKLQQSLANMTGKSDGTTLLDYGRFVAHKLADQNPESPAGRHLQVDTLHVLIAMLLFDKDGEPGMVLSKLGLDDEELCRLAKSSERET